MVSVDTLNRDAVRAFGSAGEPLPTLDRLADRSVVFLGATTPSSWTLPAHGSLMTGLYPDRHGATHDRTAMASGLKTAAGMLRSAGFVTIGFTDGGYLSRSYGLAAGFDRYDDWTDPDSKWTSPELPRDGRRSALAGEALFDRGITVIDRWSGSDGRLFLFLHTFVVHDYFLQHPWAVTSLPPTAGLDVDRSLGCLVGRESCADEEWSLLRELYRAEVRRVDRGIERLLGALDRRNLLQSTLVVILSDHGEGFSPHIGRIHHGGRLHADLIRIPLMIAGPGVVPRVTHVPVSLVDVMPTLLELCGVREKVDVDGVSFADVLRGADLSTSRWLYAMEHCYWWRDGRRRYQAEPSDQPVSMAVMRGNSWYIADVDSEELYDLATDPLQLNDLVPDPHDAVAYRERVEARSRFRVQGLLVDRERSVEQQLRALGYVE
jgi:arylsulfatase A-like enzyme